MMKGRRGECNLLSDVIEIRVRNCGLIDEDLENFASFENLQLLDLKGNQKITNDGIKLLTKYACSKTLTSMNLSKIRGTVVLKDFPNLKYLKTQSIENCPGHGLESLIIDSFYSEIRLKGLNKLRHFSIECSSFANCSELLELPSLESLSLIRIDGIDIKLLRGIAINLKSLRLGGFNRITIADIASLIKDLKSIESLSLDGILGYHNIEDYDSTITLVQALTDSNILGKLTYLNLEGNCISDKAIENLVTRNNLENLKSLNLSSFNVSCVSTEIIAMNLKNLESLTLEYLRDVHSLKKLENGLPKLKHLNIDHYLGDAHELDNFCMTPFVKKLQTIKVFRETYPKHPYKRDTELLKTCSKTGLIDFTLNNTLLDNEFRKLDSSSNRNENDIFRVKLMEIHNLLPHHTHFLIHSGVDLELVAELRYGTKTIIEKSINNFVFDLSFHRKCEHWFEFTRKLKELPYETNICITMSFSDDISRKKRVASQCFIPIFDSNRNYNEGMTTRNLYDTSESFNLGNDCNITLCFEKYMEINLTSQNNPLLLTERVSQNFSIESLIEKQELTIEEKVFLFENRNQVLKTSGGFKKLLESCQFPCLESMKWMRSYLTVHCSTYDSPFQYLELLDEYVTDTEMRNVAHRALYLFSDEQLLVSIDILVSIIGFELHEDNPISELLIQRSLTNTTIGRKLLWSIQGRISKYKMRRNLSWLFYHFITTLNDQEMIEEFCNQCRVIYSLEKARQQVLNESNTSMFFTKSTLDEKILKRVSEISFSFKLPFPPYRSVTGLKKVATAQEKRRPLIFDFETEDNVDFRFILKEQYRESSIYLMDSLRLLKSVWKESYNEEFNYLVPFTEIMIDPEVSIIESDPFSVELSKDSLSDLDISPQNQTVHINFQRSYSFGVALLDTLFSLRRDNFSITKEGLVYTEDIPYTFSFNEEISDTKIQMLRWNVTNASLENCEEYFTQHFQRLGKSASLLGMLLDIGNSLELLERKNVRECIENLRSHTSLQKCIEKAKILSRKPEEAEKVMATSFWKRKK